MMNRPTLPGLWRVFRENASRMRRPQRRKALSLLRHAPGRIARLRSSVSPRNRQRGFWNVVYATSAAVIVTGAPFVLGTDFVDVPVGGGTGTGIRDGENGLGGYLTIYGLYFGTQANLGTALGAKVYIGGAEVANYRYLIPTKGTTDAGVTNGDPRHFVSLGVQVGSAAVKALTLGTAYQVTVVVNGVTSNLNDVDGTALTATPISAPIIYVDEQNGNEANSGIFTSPKAHWQTGTSSTVTGVAASNNLWNSGTQSGGMVPGTQCVGRQGTGGYVWTFAATHTNRWVDIFRLTGTSPNGNASGGGVGVNNGYLKWTSYPGPILGNAPETVTYQQPGGITGGGFNGNDSARAEESTPFGTTGYAAFIAVSNLSIAINAGATSSDACPINMQNDAESWRVFNNELTWPSTLVNGSNGPFGAGISGDRSAVSMFNYIHNINDISGGQQNHGIYHDATQLPSLAGVYAANCVTAYNSILNIQGGSGIQCFTNKISGTDKYGNLGMVNMSIHHNYIFNVAKHGLNCNYSTKQVNWYCNLIVGVGRYPFCFGGDTSSGGTNGAQIGVVNNTFYAAAGDGLDVMIENDYNCTLPTVSFQNNLVIMSNSRSNTGLGFYGNDSTDAGWVRQNNMWTDPQGHTTSPPSGGTGEIYTANAKTTSFTDFSLQATSPAIGAATTNAYCNPVYDFMLNPMTRVGQTKNSIGAYA